MATDMGVLIAMKTITTQTSVMTSRPGGMDTFPPMKTRAAVKIITPIAANKVQTRSFLLKIFSN